MPEVPSQLGPQRPPEPSLRPFISGFNRVMGNDYTPPVGFVDNVRESAKIFGDVRNAVSRLSRFNN